MGKRLFIPVCIVVTGLTFLCGGCSDDTPEPIPEMPDFRMTCIGYLDLKKSNPKLDPCCEKGNGNYTKMRDDVKARHSKPGQVFQEGDPVTCEYCDPQCSAGEDVERSAAAAAGLAAGANSQVRTLQGGSRYVSLNSEPNRQVAPATEVLNVAGPTLEEPRVEPRPQASAAATAELGGPATPSPTRRGAPGLGASADSESSTKTSTSGGARSGGTGGASNVAGAIGGATVAEGGAYATGAGASGTSAGAGFGRGSIRGGISSAGSRSGGGFFGGGRGRPEGTVDAQSGSNEGNSGKNSVSNSATPDHDAHGADESLFGIIHQIYLRKTPQLEMAVQSQGESKR